MRQSNNGKTILISEDLFIEAHHKDGLLLGAVGAKVKAQQIELNNVKVEKGGETFFLELGENVRWMEVELQ